MGIGRNTGTRYSSFGMLLIQSKEFDMTRQFKVTLFGNDQGACNVLDAVAQAAAGHGDVDLVRVPGLNEVVSEESLLSLAQSDVVVFGISSGDKSGVEARLGVEVLRRTPALSGKIIFVEDFPGSSGVADSAHRAIGLDSHLCSIMTLPPDAPERKIYRSVQAVGLPDHWSPSLQNILEGERFRRSGLKKRRHGTDECVPVESNAVIIYFSGSQDPSMEASALRVLFSIQEIESRPVLVHFRAHPGERNRAELKDGIAARDALLDGRWELASPEVTDVGRLTDSRLIGASDVTVAHPGATSIFFAAALRRRMVCPMEFVTEIQRSTSSWDYGQAARYTHVVDRLSDVPSAIAALLRDNSSEEEALRRKQEANTLPFDATTPLTYGKNVMEFIRSVTG